jgi:hypothetical protein
VNRHVQTITPDPEIQGVRARNIVRLHLQVTIGEDDDACSSRILIVAQGLDDIIELFAVTEDVLTVVRIDRTIRVDQILPQCGMFKDRLVELVTLEIPEKFVLDVL